MHYEYKTQGTCSRAISFDIDGNVVSNIQFLAGCHGNLKAIAKILDGWTVEEIEAKCKGNTCQDKSTSCADQLARAVRSAYEAKQT